MEQIIVTHKNGTTLKLQSKANVSRISRCTQTVELLGQDVIDISVESAKKLTFLLGDKITIIGRDYTLNTPATERKLSETQFVYDLQFEGVQYDMIRAAYSVNVDTTSNEIQDINGDSLTGDLKRFLDVLISNLNRVFPAKWVLGTYPANTETRTETFSDTDNCLNVLQSLCSEDKYNTEFYIDIAENGTRTLNVGATGANMAYTFEYGKSKGIYELTRQKISSSNIVTRLNVFGSSKNIMTSKYRAFKLCLPTKSKSQSYIENSTAIAKYGVWEGTKNFEDIFPHREGTVSSLGVNELKFVDSSMDFDLNAKDGEGNTLYLMAGTSAKIHFNTGNLAGYEFEVASYNHSTKEFELLSSTDENGYTFPSPTSGAFQFAEGDKYTITDIYMPQSYVDTAEAKLATAGADYLAKYSQPLVSYGLTVDSFFLRDIVGMEVESNLLWAGDYIPVKDTDLDVDKTIRVKGFTRDLLRDYSYSLTIADLPITVSTITKIITEINQTDKVIKYNNLNDPARARRNYKAASELVTMIETVQAEAILVGNDPAAQFDLTGVAIRANYNKNANTIDFSTGTIVHNYYPIGSPGTWTISDGNFAGLTPETAYYVYIKASKSAATAVFYLSSTKIGVEDVTGHYHFPLGLLSSVIDGARVFTSTKGYTLITGDSIKTGRISSNDGTRYFDLTTGEFKGDFKFTSGTSVETAIGTAESNAISAAASDATTKAGAAQTNAINTSLEYGTGKNLLPQAEFANGLDDWAYGYSLASLAAPGRGVNLNSDWALNGNTNLRNNQGLNTIFMTHGNWVDEDGDYAYLVSQPIKGIQGGKKYIISAYVANHRAINVSMYIEFYNSNGSWLNYSGMPATAICGANEADGGKNINGYKRIYAVVTAHQDAVSANIVIRKYGTVEGSLDSYMFVCRPMLEQVADQTTKPGVWSPYASGAEIAESKALLADIASDSKLTPNEKIQVKKEWLAMQEQFTVIDNQCVALGLDDYSENSTYTDLIDYYSQLNSYITPLLADMAVTSNIVSATFNTKFTNCYSGFEAQRAQINSTINTKAVNAQSTADNASISAANAADIARAMQNGKMLNRDPMFKNGVNGINLYNNAGGGDVTVSRVSAIADSPNTIANIKISVRSPYNTSPGLAGFYFATITRANAVFITRIVAKIPVGYSINFASNGIGNNNVTKWLTSQAGTGRFEEYIYYVKSGTSGTFSSTNFFYLSGTPASIDWYLSFATVYDITDNDIYTIDKVTELDYLKAALTGSTEISGGLVGTNVILLKTLAGLITGGMSGLSNDNIGLWTGGTYQNAIDSLAKIILRKDGSGQLAGGKILWDLLGALKVGNFDIINGNIIGRDADSIEKLKLSIEDIPTIASMASTYAYLISGANYYDLFVISSLWDSEIGEWYTQVIAGSMQKTVSIQITLPYATSIIVESGGVSFEVNGNPENVTGSSATQSVYVRNLSGAIIAAGSLNSNIQISSAGTYNVEVITYTSVSLVDGAEYVSVGYFINNIAIKYIESVEKTALGKDGLFSYFTGSEYIHFKKLVGFSGRGKFDIPAGLGGGTVASGGTTTGGWGKYTPTSSRSSATVTITHNIGSSNYSLIITPLNSFTYYITSKGTNTVNVVMSTTSGIFDYVIIRTT